MGDELTNIVSSQGKEFIYYQSKLNNYTHFDEKNVTENDKENDDSWQNYIIKLLYGKNSNDETSEGMQNLNMSDVNGILDDSKLIVLQENYRYMGWSILAIAALIMAMRAMKK